jgi:HEAT repeat protein
MQTLAWLILALSPAQDDKAADEALKAFTAEFKGADADRVAAVAKLAQTKHAKVASKLGSLLPGGPTQVRIAAAKSLGDFADHKKPAATALANAIAPNAKEIPVLDPIFEAIGKLQEPGVVPVLVRYFEDKDVELAKRAVAAAGRVQSPTAIDPLIALLAKSQKAAKSGGGGGVGFNDPATGAGVVLGADQTAKARADALVQASNAALQAITGETHATSDAWSAWWAKNRATFKK